jgi:uncharacterized RDD family membrane protein YckC
MATETTYGGFWVRLLAYLVDSVILVTAFWLLAIGAVFLGEWGLKLVLLLWFLGPLAYWVLMQASSRQATLGKALLGLKVTDDEGERLSILRSLGRELAKFVSALPMMIGFLLAAFTGRKQALHDMIASTTVVRQSSGHVVLGLMVAVFGWLAPGAIVVLAGAGVVMSLMGTMGGDMMREAMKEAPRQQAANSFPAPEPGPASPAQRPPEASVAAAGPALFPAKPVPATAAPSPMKESAPAATASVALAPAATTPPPRELPPSVAPKPKLAAQAKAPPPVTPIAKLAPVALMPDAPAQPALKYNDLMTAVMYGDSAAVGELLALGKWPEKRDRNGVTPLAAAAKRGDQSIAELLLKAGADPSQALAVARERRDDAMSALLEKYRK